MAEQVQISLITTTACLVEVAELSVTAACALTGVARSSYYRIRRGYRHYVPVAAPIAQRDRVQPAALTQAEREQVLEVLGDPAYAELSVGQTYWRAFDDGKVACSARTFYRIAAKAGLVGDRRRGRHSGDRAPRPVPRHSATGPGQLWSWDITELHGPGGRRYQLYLVIDVYSRYPVAWRIDTIIHDRLAAEMLTHAFANHGAPTVLHSDNGAPMRSHAVAKVMDKKATASFSRPRVCNDNPFSESLFKTIKYDTTCPDHFDDIEHARDWTAKYLRSYAKEHRHSGLGWHTPAQVYNGTITHARAKRQQRLDALHRQHPHRYRQPPKAPEVPEIAGINHKHKTSQAA